MSNRFYSISAVLFLALFPRSELAAQSGRGAGIGEGEPVPKVKAADKEGREVDLSEPKRFTVLVFGSHT